MTPSLLSLMLIILIAWFLLPLVLRQLQVRHLECLCATGRSIVLTYDDGPSPETTSALLDLLTQREVPATFFVIGSPGRGESRSGQSLAARGPLNG